MNRYRLTLAAAVCCALSLYFVDGEAVQTIATVAASKVEKVASVAHATTTPDNATPDKATPDTSSSAEQSPEDASSADQETAVVDIVEEHTLAFEPPFPDRMNIFQAPKRQGRGSAKTNTQSETAVELLGFVNVNGQRVALSIDGMVTTIAEGGQAYGIEVISIQPPSVFLRSGKQRWQASFEN